MKRRSCILSLLLLCFATAFAKADTHVVTNIPIPDRYRPILEVCGAENEEEMFEKLVQFTTVVDPERARRLPNWCKQEPIQIHYGGTTKELLADKKWDLAIVSSKDVDLQALAEKRIYYGQFGFSEPTFHQLGELLGEKGESPYARKCPKLV